MAKQLTTKLRDAGREASNNTETQSRRSLQRRVRHQRPKMKINTIQVTAGRTFNHPHEQYSNLRPEVTMTATLEDGEDAGKATRELQAKAEQIVEDHKRGLLTSIEELYQLTERQAEMRGLQQELERAQKRLEAIRSENPTLQLGV